MQRHFRFFLRKREVNLNSPYFVSIYYSLCHSFWLHRSIMADAAKKKEELVKEVKMTVHLKEPLEGIKDLAREFGFQEPNSIDEYLERGLTNAEADVSSFSLLSKQIIPPSSFPVFFFSLAKLLWFFFTLFLYYSPTNNSLFAITIIIMNWLHHLVLLGGFFSCSIKLVSSHFSCGQLPSCALFLTVSIQLESIIFTSVSFWPL